MKTVRSIEVIREALEGDIGYFLDIGSFSTASIIEDTIDEVDVGSVEFISGVLHLVRNAAENHEKNNDIHDIPKLFNA